MLAILTALKLFWKRAKSSISTAIILVTLIAAIVQIVVQDGKDQAAKKQKSIDSLRNVIQLDSAKRELKFIQAQNDSLSGKITSLKNDNHSLIGSVKSFREYFHQNAQIQEGVNEYITGGDNLPIIRISVGRLPNKNPKANFEDPDSIRYSASFAIVNDGYVPIKNVSVQINNGIDNITYKEKFPSLTQKFGPTIKSYELPLGKDTSYFDGTVIWDGENMRAYMYNFVLVRKKNPLRDYTISKVYTHVGDKLGRYFNPDSLLNSYLAKSKKSPKRQ